MDRGGLRTVQLRKKNTIRDMSALMVGPRGKVFISYVRKDHGGDSGFSFLRAH